MDLIGNAQLEAEKEILEAGLTNRVYSRSRVGDVQTWLLWVILKRITILN